MLQNDCLKGSLKEYVPSLEKPWNERRVHHLFNKLSTGAPFSLIQRALATGPSIIDDLLAEAKSHPLPGEVKNTASGVIDYSVAWKEQTTQDFDQANPQDLGAILYEKRNFMFQMWMNGLIEEGIRHKLVLFWSNHFTSEMNAHTWTFQYYYLLHKNALGNFKQFVMDMGRTPLMLIYLDGAYSYAISPNENYARELLELFTMGVGNYTEEDVAEIARVMTGWTIEYSFYDFGVKKWVNNFLPNKVDEFLFRGGGNFGHDFGSKTVLGRKIPASTPKSGDLKDEARLADLEYQKLHDIIFEERELMIAKFICKKLYKHYLYEFPPDEIIEGLADVFISSNWDILSVLKTLFRSEHFFEEANMGLNIKSHIENVIHFYRLLGLRKGEDYFMFKIINDTRIQDPMNIEKVNTLEYIYYQTYNLNQGLFNPPNVAGWLGYRNWLNEFTLVNRWRIAIDQVNGWLPYPNTKQKYRQFLKDISNNSMDPYVIITKLLENFIPITMSEDILNNAVDAFKSPVPINYFDDGTWTLDYIEVPKQFETVMFYIFTLPEYNLL
jgi:uncharacterized protein (DUF1800 family)